MGCWNETCAITQMPIRWEDPVVLVFLAKVDQSTDSHNGFCYTNAIWTPKFLPVFGKYDDYGGVENIEENWNTRFILDRLRDELTQVRLSQPHRVTQDPDDLHNDVKAEQLDLDSFTLQDLMEEIHDDKVWVPGVKGRLPLGWCMMHRWAWDHLTQVMERDWRDNLTLDTVKSHGDAYYQAMWERHNAAPSAENVAGGWLFKWRRQLVDHTNVFSIMDESGYHMDGYYVASGIKAYGDLLWNLAEQQTPLDHEQVQHCLQLLGEHLILINNMGVLRKFWSPQAGKGSQTTAYKRHLALHELCVSKIQDRMQEEWAEDYQEDEPATDEVS